MFLLNKYVNLFILFNQPIKQILDIFVVYDPYSLYILFKNINKTPIRD